jgi:Ca2+-binding RTX toxin-like protein
VTAVVFVLAALAPSVANAATPKCFGKKATIVSNKATINGTKKDDVIVSNSRGGFNQINGKGGNDLICGGPMFDFIRGGPGNDKVRGNGDFDFLVGDGGNDHLYGDKNDGDQADDAWYAFSLNPVNVNLETGRVTGEGTDTLHDIAGVFGSQFDDTITGNGDTNFLWGNGGNDTINGGLGLDLVTPGPGNDTVDGGSEANPVNDSDILYVNDATGPATVDLQSNTASGDGIGTDSVSAFEHVVGSSYDDSLDGSNASNMFFGGAGNDSLNGRGGFDYGGYWFAAGPVNANLQTNSSTGQVVMEDGVDIGEGNDTFQALEGLLGSISFDDTLTGDNQANYIDGDGGRDVMAGGGGNDWFVGGLGTNEQVDGGAGANDFWDYYGAYGLNINLASGTITSLDLGTLQITGVESVSGADLADSFIGDANANTFYGWSGNDTFNGGDGDDRFDGGAGTDTWQASAGNDTCFAVETLGACVLSPQAIPPHELSSEASAVETMRRNF